MESGALEFTMVRLDAEEVAVADLGWAIKALSGKAGSHGAGACGPSEQGSAMPSPVRFPPLVADQACCFKTQVTALPSYGGMRLPLAIGAVVL